MSGLYRTVDMRYIGQTNRSNPVRQTQAAVCYVGVKSAVRKRRLTFIREV